MKAVDNYLLTKEVLSHHFMTKGMRAVFLAKTPGDYGNGCHVHISLWRNGENVMGDQNRKYKLSEVGENFIAGIQ
jgi:glutamine synthetase